MEIRLRFEDKHDYDGLYQYSERLSSIYRSLNKYKQSKAASKQINAIEKEIKDFIEEMLQETSMNITRDYLNLLYLMMIHNI